MRGYEEIKEEILLKKRSAFFDQNIQYIKIRGLEEPKIYREIWNRLVKKKTDPNIEIPLISIEFDEPRYPIELNREGMQLWHEAGRRIRGKEVNNNYGTDFEGCI